MDIEDFDIELESDYYNKDYDDVDSQQEEEIKEESDILFE